jgi:hypothetical protein
MAAGEKSDEQHLHDDLERRHIIVSESCFFRPTAHARGVMRIISVCLALHRRAMVRILSLDVGVKNLGACELECERDGTGLKIGFWGVLTNPRKADTMQSVIAGAVDAVVELDSRSGGFGWDHVLIENQPCMKNPRMKAVQTAIHTLLVQKYGEEVDVRPTGAVGKNKVADLILCDSDSSSPSYRKNKQRSVDAALSFLRARDWAEELLALEASPKKDDMSDALLQGLFFLSTKLKILSL